MKEEHAKLQNLSFVFRLRRKGFLSGKALLNAVSRPWVGLVAGGLLLSRARFLVRLRYKST